MLHRLLAEVAEHDAPHFGAAAGFERKLDVLRVVAWVIVLPLLVIGTRWMAPGSAVESSVLRAALIYGVLLFLLRLAGKRTLAQMTSFDLLVLLVLSEGSSPRSSGTTSRSRTPSCSSPPWWPSTSALALPSSDCAPHHDGWMTSRRYSFTRGLPVPQAMTRSRVGIDDIMEAARESHGIAKFADVRFAVLERGGEISIVPRAGNPVG